MIQNHEVTRKNESTFFLSSKIKFGLNKSENKIPTRILCSKSKKKNQYSKKITPVF